MAVSAVKKEPAKEQEAAAAAVMPAKKNIRKYLKILVILSVVSGVGGGAYWYLNQPKSDKPEAKALPAKPPVFVPLETFTVNLQLEDNPQFLQAGLSLKVTDSTVADALKLHMPEVRDRILLLLSARKASEILTVDGKRKLSADIVAAVNAILDPAAAEPAPPAKAAPEAPPPVATEASAPANGEEKPPADAAAPATATAPAAEPAAEPATPPAAEPPAVAKGPVLQVLFTSFIVQ